MAHIPSSNSACRNSAGQLSSNRADAPGVAGQAAAPVVPLLACEGLTKVFATAKRGRQSLPPALKDVTLGVRSGECLGVVGESGSGKTTLANCLTGLLHPTAGTVTYDGEVVCAGAMRRGFPRVHGIQIVFQDPASSLNPRRTVGSVLLEIIRVHDLRPKDAAGARVGELLGLVGLDPGLACSRPSRLSGGQQQRVAIARALAFEPRLIVADEIVSALDASVQAQILNLLADLREQLRLAIVLVTHDMSVARHLCDRIIVMRSGEVVEDGQADQVLLAPAHPYTRELLRAVPRLENTPTPAADSPAATDRPAVPDQGGMA
jgi:ABC-type glutathione transport system ATPase component